MVSQRILAALDVYDREPLPADGSLGTADCSVLTPHLGYGVSETWKEFFGPSRDNWIAFLKGEPGRVVNPGVEYIHGDCHRHLNVGQRPG